MVSLQKAGEFVEDFFIGGIKSFIKKPSIGTGTMAALDVVTLIPVAKAAKVVSKLGVAKVVLMETSEFISKSAAAGKIVNFAKSLIPKTTKGKIIAAVATPVLIGAAIREPESVAKTVASAPGELGEFGGDVATLLKDPSAENLKNLFGDSPIITSILGGLTAYAGAKALTGYLQARAISEQTEVQQASARETLASQERIAAQNLNFLSNQQFQTQQQQLLSSVKTAGGGAAAAAPSPVLPQTQVLTPTTTHHHHRKPVKQQINRISQRVNVLVGNKTFINGTSQRSYYGY